MFLTSGATSPRLSDQVPDYLFLACFGDNVQAAAAAETAFKGALELFRQLTPMDVPEP